MATKSTKDPNLFAKRVFENLLDKLDPDAVTPSPEPEGKDPKRQAAGRKGGKKGGIARAAKLSPQDRRAIAEKAAKSRWKEPE